MKQEEEKKLDRIFKKGLASSEDHIAYHDEDWDAMEELLDEHKKRRAIIFRLPVILGSIAAMLLLALGFFFLRPEVAHKKGNDIVKVKAGKQQPVKIDTNLVKGKGDKLSSPIINTATRQLVQGSKKVLNKPNNINEQLTAELKVKATVVKSNNNTTNKPEITNSYDKEALFKPADVLGSKQPIIASVDTGNNKVSSQQQQQILAAVNQQTTAVQTTDTPAKKATIIVPVKEKNKPSVEITGVKHPIVLSIIAAPDFNGVGSAFNRTQVGTNAGLLLSVGITRKLTLSTGAIYAKKPYMAGMDQYKTNYKFRVQPDDVSADCRVLDIPLNIDYQVYNKGNNMFSIGTGLSSYFMLRENYHYNHSGYYSGPSDYNIKNKNQHIMGVVNLNATYQRRINSKFGLNVQPYMKLPITNIGYGQVNLKSTGLAIGASWYLNTSAFKK